MNLSIEIDGARWHKDKYDKDYKKFQLLKEKGIVALNVRQVGLQSISENDIYFPRVFKDELLIITVLAAVIRLFPNNDRLSEIQQYLSAPEIKNRSLLNSLLSKLPGPLEGKSLADISKKIAAEFHPILNGEVTPEHIHNGSHRKVWWNCPVKHDPYLAVVKSRTLSGHGCPKCGAESSIRSRSTAIKVYKNRKHAGAYSSVSAAAKALKLSAASIMKHLGQGTQHRSGFTFERAI